MSHRIMIICLVLMLGFQLCAAEKVKQGSRLGAFSMATVPVLQQGSKWLGHRLVAESDEDTIFSTTFEGVSNWTTQDLTNPGNTWHRDAYNAYAGQSWWSGKASLSGYDNNWLQYLVSPVLDLSDATNPVLTCSLYWAVEEPSFFQGYDGWDGCNVWISANGGFSWQVLEPIYPAYTCRNLYSFGWLWEMSPDSIAGWAGFSGGWRSARFDLSAFTATDIRLRFAFCSDAATCTADDPSLYGFFLDNVEIKDGSTVYLQNMAEGGAFPSEFTMSAGTPRGNFWTITTEQWHSSSHSWNCDDRPFLSNALISPVIAIPANQITLMNYWVFCDMPDVNGDNDEFLDDYYYIEVAPAGSAVWTPVVYDYGFNGSQLQWVQRTNGLWNGLPTNNINLSPWAGQNVKIRFRVVTDGNSDGGDGQGVYIDDVLLTAATLPNSDVGAERIIVPFPTYAGQAQVPGTVGLANFGIINQPAVPAYWSVNGAATSFLPWSQISPSDTVFRSFTWTPPSSGLYDLKAFTQLTSDEDHSNDTAYAGIVDVTPAGFFELGYDHRQLTYLPDFYYFNFGPGSGPLVHFTPAADGIPGILYGNTIRAMFYSAGTLTVHIFADGPGGVPGAEVYSAPAQITAGEIYPDAWAEIDVSGVAYLQGGHPNFWVWLEVTSPDNTPHITGHLIDAFSFGHFYTYDGSDVNPTLVNFNVRATLTGSAAVADEPQRLPYAFALQPNFPNPFNSSTTLSYTLGKPSQVRLSVYNLTGEMVRLLEVGERLPGNHLAKFSAGDLPSGIYLCRLQADQASQTLKMLLLK